MKLQLPVWAFLEIQNELIWIGDSERHPDGDTRPESLKRPADPNLARSMCEALERQVPGSMDFNEDSRDDDSLLDFEMQEHEFEHLERLVPGLRLCEFYQA